MKRLLCVAVLLTALATSSQAQRKTQIVEPVKSAQQIPDDLLTTICYPGDVRVVIETASGKNNRCFVAGNFTDLILKNNVSILLFIFL